MRFAAALLLPVVLLAGACNGTSAQPTIKEKEEARAAELAKLNGWDKLFGAPDAAVGAANQFGFRPTPYAAVDNVYRSTGGPVMIAGSMATEPSRVSFAAEGPAATKVSTIRFGLSVGSEKFGPDARKRFADTIRDYLFQAGIEADALLPAIRQGVPAKGNLTGTPYSIDTSKADGKDVLTVTFTRTGAAAPDSKPQGN
jgi:hypothetical protein